ncbi:MAG: hypothetical protein C5B59_16385 [Bacteroidetes bacterium]|nr:MAG: hypothetical protein C5B59_16385 [Bacteroidota bacterium]
MNRLSTYFNAWVISLFCLTARAQETKSHRWQFHSLNQLGLLEGGSGSAFQMQTVNGIAYKGWFSGIGVGIDNYYFRSIPLFLDIRKNFRLGAGYIFTYGDGGIQFAWLTDRQITDMQNRFWTYSFSNGGYADLGLGYRIVIKNKLAFLLSAGYSYKYSEAKVVINYCPLQEPCDPSHNTYHFNLDRLTFKAGIEF